MYAVRVCHPEWPAGPVPGLIVAASNTGAAVWPNPATYTRTTSATRFFVIGRPLLLKMRRQKSRGVCPFPLIRPIRLEPAATHHLARRPAVLRRDVEKRAYPLAAANHAAAIFVGLDQIIDARIGQQLLQAQRFLELFRDVDQGQLLFAEIIGFLLHARFLSTNDAFQKAFMRPALLHPLGERATNDFDVPPRTP